MQKRRTHAGSGGKHDTSMAAVVKLTAETVENLCGQYTEVYPVNYNCPGQISVSGAADQMADFAVSVKNAGGRAIPLKVKGCISLSVYDRSVGGFCKRTCTD